jgi:hypothetical protein
LSKYDPISAHLAGLPPGQDALRVGFKTLDELLGTPLPKTARSDRTWWANTVTSNHARSWLSAGWKVQVVDLGAGEVELVRQNGNGVTKAERRVAFARLQQFFLSLPTEQQQVPLTFAEIETIIERKLRQTALTDRTWWANAQEYEPSRYWLAAGWRVEGVYMKSRLIVFRRKGTAVLETIRHWVKRFLEPGSVVGGPDARTIAPWIQQCRRVCWFFEGTVLFERSGVSLAGLDEMARADVEEDYEVCKRELNRYKLAISEPAMASAVRGES